MAERVISVLLKAQVSDFTREMGKASKSLDELVKREDKHGSAAQTTAGRIVQSARLQSEAWSTVGSSLAATGAAMTGFNVVVAKTGIEYNTLQQTSRAALRAILGGAQAANEQMDKLDAFARTSPFSKAVFIQAQQQMLGFGIEARKVIPYLTAINEAVAATGGSNQDIAELTRIFSQVQAASKITATDLMQFGQRGVDAATLIGSQMGKTGAQIREEITAGTLDAGTALDALAAGMQSRFEGASAGVKHTMTGAIDRVKAAWRDLSASLMEGAVGREGGGWLVGATNGLADFIRMVEKTPQPVKDFAFGLSAISGAALLAGGGLIASVPRILETVKAFRELGDVFPGIAAGLSSLRYAGAAAGVALGAIGIVIAAVAASSAGMAQKQAEAAGRVEAFTTALQNQGDALQENLRQAAAKQLQDAGALDMAERLGFSLQAVTDAALGNADAYDAVASALARQRAEIERSYAAGEIDLQQRSAMLRDNYELKQAIDQTGGAYRDAAAGAKQMGDAVEESNAPIADQAALAKEAREALQQLATAQLALSGSQLGVEKSVIAANKQIAETAKVMKDAKASTEDKRLAEIASLEALDQVAAASLRLRDAQREANVSAGQIDAAMTKNRASFIKTATQMGYNATEAEMLADSYGLIPSYVSTAVEAPGATASAEQVLDLRRKIDSLPPHKRAEVSARFMTEGYAAAKAAYDSIRGKTVPIVAEFRVSGAANVTTRIAAMRAYGGPLPGYAPHDRADNVLYAGTPGEWVIQRPTTRHYGDKIMADFNAGKFAKEDLQRLQGLAYGGEVGSWRRYQSSMLPARYASTASTSSPSGAPVQITYAPQLRTDDPRRQFEEFSWQVGRDLAGRMR